METEGERRLTKKWEQKFPIFPCLRKSEKKASLITEITDELGQIWEMNDQIGGAFTRYFQELFTTSGTRQMERALEVVDLRVTQAMNESLLKA